MVQIKVQNTHFVLFANYFLLHKEVAQMQQQASPIW
jgi:hypothetical protein